MEEGKIYGGARSREPFAKERCGETEGEAMGSLQHIGAQRLEAGACEENAAYGCLFCRTGKEQSVADCVQASCPDVRAITMRKIRYRTCKKTKWTEEAIVLPGYVFFRAPSYIEPVLSFPLESVIRVLSVEGDWHLHGADEQFARWLFQYDGLLSLSKAYRDGDRIRIAGGPLKDMEGKIRRVDKRGCSGQVVLSFNGKEITTWLSFELIDRID